MTNVLTIIAAMLFQLLQAGPWVFDRMVYDWGDVCVSDGALSCEFNVKNDSDQSKSIMSVVSSCGCTNVSWTTGEIAPGQSGVIRATYNNEDGPGPFDKTLTVYFSDQNKPSVLHLRGVVHLKKMSLEESYPVHYGPLGFRSSEIKVGNLSQGEVKSGECLVANVSKKSVKLSFTDITPGLSIKIDDPVIPAGGTTRIVFTVTSDRNRWGKNYYYATPLADGKSYASKGQETVWQQAAGSDILRSDPNPALAEGSSTVGFWAITKENNASASKEDRKNGPQPKFEDSTFSFGKVKAGQTVKASFKLSNSGKKDLVVYKIDCESLRVSGPVSAGPVTPGKSQVLEFTIDTNGLPKGEQLFLLTLYTNSPVRPILNLYINGNIL